MDQPRKPTPKSPDTQKSSVYTEAKLRNDYKLFIGEEGADTKPISQIQQELFDLLAKGGIEDENQAFEWLLARKWSEFDDNDGIVIKQLASDKGKKEFADIWKLR